MDATQEPLAINQMVPLGGRKQKRNMNCSHRVGLSARSTDVPWSTLSHNPSGWPRWVPLKCKRTFRLCFMVTIPFLMFLEGTPAWNETRCRSSTGVQPPSFKVISMSQRVWGHHCPPISSRSFRQRKEHRILYFPPRHQQILLKSVHIKERRFPPLQDACSIRWGGDTLSCTTWAGVAGHRDIPAPTLQGPSWIQGDPCSLPTKTIRSVCLSERDGNSS